MSAIVRVSGNTK